LIISLLNHSILKHLKYHIERDIYLVYGYRAGSGSKNKFIVSNYTNGRDYVVGAVHSNFFRYLSIQFVNS